MEAKKFLTAEEVTAEFGLNAESLQALIDSGDLQALADRGTWKYRRDELQELVDSGRIQLPSLSEGVLKIHDPDDLSYIELDEEALSEQATTIKKGSDEGSSDWFVPSDAVEMHEEDIAASISADSDSDVKIAPDYSSSNQADESAIVLDFGPETDDTGSALRLPQTVPGSVDDIEIPDFQIEEVAEIETVGELDEVEQWDEVGASDSSVRLGGDSAFGQVPTGDAVVPDEESGIVIEEADSKVGSSILGAQSMTDESDLDLGEDSGIALDDSSLLAEEVDSGITLESEMPDSGISIETGKPDSGISLSAGDSGITLLGDSGIGLEGDSGIAIDSNSRTVADDERSSSLADEGDRTQTLDLVDQFDEDSTFDINLDDQGATRELKLDDDDDADETSATVVRKGRPAQGALSAAFELDDAEVEDLEISDDLDAEADLIDADSIDEILAEEEEVEVFDASEEAFGEDEAVAEEDDEDYLEPAAESKKKATGPREPSWGMGMTIGLVCCTLFLAANSVILWAGISTMWNGADAEGPAGSLIQTFGDIIPK